MSVVGLNSIYQHKIYATYSESNLYVDLLGCNAEYCINTAYKGNATEMLQRMKYTFLLGKLKDQSTMQM